MILLDGYALLVDISKKTGTTPGALCMRGSLEKEMFGGLVAIKISSLYKSEQVETLIDLGTYTTPKMFSLEIGRCSTYLSVHERLSGIRFESVYLDNKHIRLIKIPKELLDLIKRNKVLYKLAKGEIPEGGVFDFNGLKIGYY